VIGRKISQTPQFLPPDCPDSLCAQAVQESRNRYNQIE